MNIQWLTHTLCNPQLQHRPCIHISGCHCMRALKQVIHWQWIKWDVIIFEQSLVEQIWIGWETCVAPGLHYCCAFYSSQTEVNASQSNCMPACEQVWFWLVRVAEEQLVGRAVELGEGGGWIWERQKISLWLSSQEMAWDIHFSVSLPPTLLLLSISHTVAIVLVHLTFFSFSASWASFLV